MTPNDPFADPSCAKMMASCQMPDHMVMEAQLAFLAIFSEYHGSDVKASVIRFLSQIPDDHQQIGFLIYVFGGRAARNVSPEVWSWIFSYFWYRNYLDRVFDEGTVSSMFAMTVREHMMTGEELRQLAALPDEIEVFRGTAGRTMAEARHGMHWTMDGMVAASYALWRREQRGKDSDSRLVLHGVVRKHDIRLFSLPNIGPAEIIVAPGSVELLGAGRFPLGDIDRRFTSATLNTGHPFFHTGPGGFFDVIRFDQLIRVPIEPMTEARLAA